jgi:thiol-disulfide isomerase/thioredoxin
MCACLFNLSYQRLLLCLVLVLLLPGAAPAALKAGDAVPRITYSDMNGAPVVIPDAVRGKVAIILFWTAGCSSCREDMPALDALYREYRRKGLAIAAVNVGQPLESVRTALAGLAISYPVLLDQNSRSVAAYDVIGVPRVFILDRNSTIRLKIVGSMPRETIRKAIQSLF